MKLDEYEPLRRIRQRRADVDTAQRAHNDQERARWAPHYEAVAVWEREARQAMVESREVPPRPVEPEQRPNPTALFDQQRDELAREERRVLAELRPQVEADALDTEAALHEWIGPMVSELRRAVEQYREMVEAVRTVRRAADTIDPNSTPVAGTGMADRTPRVTLAAVVATVDAGRSLLALDPLPGRSEQEPQVVPPTEPEIVLGLSHRGAFGRQPPESPAPSTRGVEI